MKYLCFFVCASFLYSSATLARECKSCQEHRNGGSISYGSGYAPGGVYQSGGSGSYYPGGVYRSYGGYYRGNPYNRGYNYPGRGSLTQTCGYGSLRGDHNASGSGCVTQYRGPASDINRLPKITRQIHRSQPHSYVNPWK